MKIGMIYPQTELGGDPHGVARLATAGEVQGYDYFVMFDHVAGAVAEGRDPPLWGPYTDRHPFHDPLVAFGYLAGLTERIELVSGILVLPQRQTLLVARQAADVDLFSGGRLRLGVGIGWNYTEFDALGQDFHRRGKRMGEQIDLLRRLWSEAPLSFAGEFDAIDRMALNPRPSRQIPIWLGGVTEPALRRAARLGDGFIFGGAPIDSVLESWSRLRGFLAREGRDAAAFGADHQMPGGISIDTALDIARRWRDAGGTHVAIRTLDCGFTELQQHEDYFAEFVERMD